MNIDNCIELDMLSRTSGEDKFEELELDGVDFLIRKITLDKNKITAIHAYDYEGTTLIYGEAGAFIVKGYYEEILKEVLGIKDKHDEKI